MCKQHHFPLSMFRLLFPGYSEKEQKCLADELLAQSGVNYTMRAQEMSVEQFGAVCNNYHKHFMNRLPSAGRTSNIEQQV